MSTKVIKPATVLIIQDKLFLTRNVFDITLRLPITKRDNHGANTLALKLGFPIIEAGCDEFVRS